METTLHFTTDIQLTVTQLAKLARQLTQHERQELVSMIIDDETFSKRELKDKVVEGLLDAKLHQEGKIELRTLTEFLSDV